MLKQVVFEEPWRGIKVTAYTDRYAYDPEDESLLFISLAGTEQAVKAISSAMIGGKGLTIKSEERGEIPVSSHPASHFRILSTKLPDGAVHQLVADTRFFGKENGREQLVVIPDHENPAQVIYYQVLAHLASPLLPEWAEWICHELKDWDQMREMEGTLKVAEISVEEATVDEIVSQGVRAGHISLEQRGGTHVGVH